MVLPSSPSRRGAIGLGVIFGGKPTGWSTEIFSVPLDPSAINESSSLYLRSSRQVINRYSSCQITRRESFLLCRPLLDFDPCRRPTVFAPALLKCTRRLDRSFILP